MFVAFIVHDVRLCAIRMLQFFASPTAYQPVSSLPTTATSSVRSLQTTRCRPTCRRTLDGWTPSGGEMGKLVEAGELRFPHLSRLMTTLLVVPAGNASSERVFSQVRKIATNFRSELGRDTLFLRKPYVLFRVGKRWALSRSDQRQVERRRLGNKLHVLGKVNSLCEVGNLSL